MIRRIHGELAGLEDETLLVRVGGLTYEVCVPPFVRERVHGRPEGSEIELSTYHYLQTDPAKSVPVLLGFETDIQRDFFELLTDVPRVGPRAALRMFSLPVATLAKAIELQDTKLLKSLPGVGAQKAKDIVATLAGKLGRFVDLAELEHAQDAAQAPLEDFETQALEILTQLGTGRADAIQAIHQVREDDPGATTADELVRRVFRSRQHA